MGKSVVILILVYCWFPIGPCKITSIEKCEGDASANNRKAKIIVFYEWELTLKWTGKCGGKDVKGFISIPNLSDENSVEDLDVSSSSNFAEQSVVVMINVLNSYGIRFK